MGAMPDLAPFRAFAEEAARAAGEILLRHGRDGDGRARSTSKGVRRELVTEADRAAEAELVRRIQASFPDHGILAEEGVATPTGEASNDSDFLWILDPLDGTTNFVHGFPFYCVSMGLAWRGEPVVGVVHAPALGDGGTTFAAHRGGGATQDGRTLKVSRTESVADALLVTGFSYVRNEPGRDDNTGRLRRALLACRDLRRFGSAELDLCMTATGQNDGYWELYLAPYDVAAGAVIVAEAGGTVTDLDGAGDWLCGGQVLATNGLLHAELLELVGNATAG